MTKKKSFAYVEPADYFPKSIRKKMKLGEFAEQNPKQTKPQTKPKKGK